jgi:hypothetical protein
MWVEGTRAGARCLFWGLGWGLLSLRCKHLNTQWLMSSLLLLSTLVPFLCDFNRIKDSIFILVCEVHQPYSLSNFLWVIIHIYMEMSQ